MMIYILAHTLAQDDSFDQNKCVRMALVHDMGEAIIGDITPADGVSEGMWLARPAIWSHKRD
jgi:5'-deoxynucleotidase YfbR-like HD superfamily hydrolase